MKKILSFLAIAVALNAQAANPDPDKKIVEKFNAMFPKADSVQWYEYGDKVTVRFYEKQVLCNLSFGSDGKVEKAVRYYDGDLLSPFFKHQLDGRFPAHSVYKVTETVSNSGTEYYIILHNEKQYLNVFMTAAGEVTIDKKFKKA